MIIALLAAAWVSVIIAACLTLLALIRRLKPTALRPATLAATYLIGITASFWFIERVTG